MQQTMFAQQVREFTIENCVNSFNAEKAEPTKVGYQYWFAGKEFLGDGRTLKMSVVAPRQATHAPHTHAEDEFFFVLEGKAEFHLNGETATGGPYTSFYCPPNSMHGIRNVGDTELKYLVVKKYQLDRPQGFDFVVAGDGSGDFRTVQEAIDAVPALRRERTRIFIKNGVYKEKLVLPPTATNVSFVGEDVEKTILTFDDFAQRKNRFGEEIGTSGSASFFIYGDGFEAENITFENSAGPVGQAVAVRVDGDKVKFENCRFLGFQDTLYLHDKDSRQYYKNCYIEGTVDFIFGISTAVFDSCEIFCKSPGYVTAASTDEQAEVGYVFRNCRITGSAPEGSVFLGRPWRPFARVVFVKCDLGSVIRPEGWDNWRNPENEKTAYYAEFGNIGPGAATAKRVDWSHVLTEAEAEKYGSLEGMLGGWNPDAAR